MIEKYGATLSPDGQQKLEALQRAVSKELEKKRRLGQYAAVWEDGKPIFIGEDAPRNSENESDQR